MDQIDNIRERLRENRNYHAVGGRYSIEQRRALLRRRFFVLGASLDKAALGILQSYACKTGRNYAFGRLW